MTRTQSDNSARTTAVYLLFAHEPYYLGDGAQEINATVVAAASLLHPEVHQPDGARIHERLTQQRTPGEIIPLATLTQELGGGAGWPYIGDWEKVTTDFVRLVRTAECDALSLGLSEIARALICTGPNNHIRTLDTAARPGPHLRPEGTRRHPGGDRHVPRLPRRRTGPLAGRGTVAPAFQRGVMPVCTALLTWWWGLEWPSVQTRTVLADGTSVRSQRPSCAPARFLG